MGTTRREYKSKIKIRLNTEGRWMEFVDYREELKAKGVPSPEAWDRAIDAFPPLEDGEEENAQPAAGSPFVSNPKRAPSAEHKKAASQREKDRRPASDFEGRECSAHKTAQWVAGHIAISDVVSEDAPSPEAWALLRWVQRSDSNEIEFWKVIYTKLLPSRTQLEAAAKFKDDGHEIVELIFEIQRRTAEEPDEQ